METVTGKVGQSLRELGPWVPIIALLAFYLVAGLDISLGGAEDDPRFGYLFLGLFAVTAIGSMVWGRRPRKMAVFCLALMVLKAGLSVLALTLSVLDFTLAFMVILAAVLGLLGLAGCMFWRRSAS